MIIHKVTYFRDGVRLTGDIIRPRMLSPAGVARIVNRYQKVKAKIQSVQTRTLPRHA